MSRKVLHINKPSDELIKLVKDLNTEKEKEKEKLLAKKNLYFSE